MEHILAEREIAMMVAAREEARPMPAGGRRPPGWRLSLAGALAVHAGLFVLLQAAPGPSRPPAVFSSEVVEVALLAEAPSADPPAAAPPATAKAPIQRETAPRPAPPAHRQRAAMPPPELARPVQPPPPSAPVETASAAPSETVAATKTPVAALAGNGGDAAASSSASGPTPAEVPAKPRYRDNPPPPYPEPARRLRLEGTVVLEALVNGVGTVNDLAVHASSGHRLLDDAALRAVRSWLFEPGKRGGMPVATTVLVPVRFALR
ncbi:TonB family protein [Desulfobulbus sp.]|uniref:energy transducer TonB n=1 Tax=Desulfobulbus sp. TaxID=895 RepID=UPI00286EFB5A|nr:TonB family protein [Desulfobulbus sp.]